MKAKFDERPFCSCGKKMTLVSFRSYYEEFKYWRCLNESCDLDKKMQNYEPDRIERGAYA